MYRFLTSTGHTYTVAALIQPFPNPDFPFCEAVTYGAILGSTHTVRAVHVFTDLERLTDTELTAAAGLYRALRDAGIPCLNDPARVMGRYQLLCNLFELGINPFAVYRADARPRPAQFPVFVRNEAEHDGPQSTLVNSQEELDAYLSRLTESGRPLRGLLVVEYAAEPGPGGVWRKTGTYRVGKNYSTQSHLLSDNWVIKHYMPSVATEALLREEQAAVIANDVPAAVRRAFDIAGIEWGRADHSKYRGRDVIFEINTNPSAMTTDRYGLAIRAESKRIAFARMWGYLRELDWGDGTVIRYRHGMLWRNRFRRLFTQATS